MKVFIILAATLSVALAQFDCYDCDNAGNRQARTGCRTFCRSSQGRDVVTREDLLRQLNDEKDTPDGMTRAYFIEASREVVGLCAEESSAAFDTLSALGGGPSDLVDESDINAAADLFELATGSSTLDKATFVEIYALAYANIGDDNCTTGK